MQKEKTQSGYIMLMAIVLLAIFLILSSSLIGYTALNLKGSRANVSDTQSLYLAEAGIARALTELNTNPGFIGVTDVALGDGTYTVNVLTVNSNQKKITATGYLPSSINPKSKKTIVAMASIDASSVSFNYGVQVGIGGLDMDNNAQITGNVYSNGSITGGNGVITGDVVVAAGTASNAEKEWTVQNSDFQFGHNSSIKDVAQSFRLNSTNPINKIQVYIKKVGSPGDLTVRIMSDNGSGSPSKTVLASSVINNFNITNSYGWVEAGFSSPTTALAGVDYWIMLSVSSSNSSNYYYWGNDSNNGNGNGMGKYSNNWNASSAVWNNVSGDLNYKIFVGGVVNYFDAGIDVGASLRAEEIRDCGSVVGTAYYNSVFNSCGAGSAVSGSMPPGPQSMPLSQSQIDDWKATAEAGGTISGTHTITAVETLGPIKIDGDLILANNAVLYLSGPVWVKGNITTNSNSIIQVAGTLGNMGTVLLADDPNNLSTKAIVSIYNNTQILGNGGSNSFPLILTTNSNTSTGAMFINNNSTAAIYYASNGTIEVANNAGGNQITGYKIHMNENAVINYVSGLANAIFSQGPGASWVLLPGSYHIEP